MGNVGAARHASGWAISVAAHGAIVVTLMMAFAPTHRRDASETLTRLVYVEPAPPPLASTAARAPSEAAAAPAAPIDLPEERTKAAAVRPPLRPRARRLTAPVPAPAADAPETLAPAADAGAGASPLGTAGGVADGTVGGLGSAPLALRDVAAPPEVLERVVPEYPPRARAMQIEGQVVVEVVLDRAGRVEETIRVTRSIPALDEAAVTAVKRWRFRPARDRDGRPVRVVMEIPVRFVLR